MVSKQLIRSLALILALAPTPAFAQKPDAPPQTEEQRQAQQELEHKTLVLLDDVIKEGDSFKQPENRIQIKARAAYILWQYDETRARNLFREVMANMADLLNNPPDAETPEVARMFGGTKMMQGEMMQMLAMRDPRMAREFLRATSTPKSQAGNKDGNIIEEPDLQLDMRLAAQVAESDPKLAVEIAEERLAKGLSYQLLGVISSLQEKDPDAAAKLAGEVMTKLRAEKLSENGGAKQIAVALLSMATAKHEKKDKAATSTPLLDQAALRELAEMIAGEALRNSGDYQTLYSMRTVMPAVEQYAPARAAQLKQKLSKTMASEEGEEGEEGTEDTTSEVVENYRSIIDKGSADELLTAAAKSQPPFRDMFYQRAAAKLAEDSDTEHARQLVNEKVQDANQRKSMLEQIDKAATMAEAERGKSEQARKMLAALHTNEERVQLLAQLAIGANAKGEKKIALKFLEDASGMINQRAKNVKQLAAQLAVAHAYVQIDPARSFAILEPMVDQLNELVSAAIVLYGFSSEEIVRDDEIMLRPMMAVLGFAGGGVVQYVNDLAVLARADFERTKNLMGKFQRDELRIIMHLTLAQSILAPASTPPSFNMYDRMYGAVDY
jgi:hypothetical protein